MGRAVTPDELVEASPRGQEPDALEEQVERYVGSARFERSLLRKLERLMPGRHEQIRFAFAGRDPRAPATLGRCNIESGTILLYEQAIDEQYGCLPAAARSLVYQGVLRHERCHALHSRYDETLSKCEGLLLTLVEVEESSDREFFARLIQTLEDGRIEQIDALEDPDGHREIAYMHAVGELVPSRYRTTVEVRFPVPASHRPASLESRSEYAVADGEAVIPAGEIIDSSPWGAAPLSSLSHQLLAALREQVLPSFPGGHPLHPRVAEALTQARSQVEVALRGNEHDTVGVAFSLYNVFRRLCLTPATQGTVEAAGPVSMPEEIASYLNAKMTINRPNKRPLAEDCPAAAAELARAFAAEDARLERVVSRQSRP